LQAVACDTGYTGTITATCQPDGAFHFQGTCAPVGYLSLNHSRNPQGCYLLPIPTATPHMHAVAHYCCIRAIGTGQALLQSVNHTGVTSVCRAVATSPDISSVHHPHMPRSLWNLSQQLPCTLPGVWQVTCPTTSITGVTGATSAATATTSNSAAGSNPASYQQVSYS
jgi:hypothetical protein